MSYCTCTFAQRLAGDGCYKCNPEKAVNIYRDSIESLENEIESLQLRIDELVKGHVAVAKAHDGSATVMEIGAELREAKIREKLIEMGWTPPEKPNQNATPAPKIQDDS